MKGYQDKRLHTLAIGNAIWHLRQARDLLVKGEATRAATDKVRRALKSAEGAQRHAQGKALRS